MRQQKRDFEEEKRCNEAIDLLDYLLENEINLTEVIRVYMPYYKSHSRRFIAGKASREDIHLLSVFAKKYFKTNNSALKKARSESKRRMIVSAVMERIYNKSKYDSNLVERHKEKNKQLKKSLRLSSRKKQDNANEVRDQSND